MDMASTSKHASKETKIDSIFEGKQKQQQEEMEYHFRPMCS